MAKEVLIDGCKEMTEAEALEVAMRDDAQVEAGIVLPKLKKLNFIVYGDGVTKEMDHPDRIIIDQAVAIQHYEYTVENDLSLDDETLDYVAMVFTDNEVTKDNWKEHGTQVQHVLGRIDCTLKLQKKNVALVWRYPEAGLFPAYNARITDVIMKLFTEDNSQSYEEKHHTLDINPEKLGK